MKESEIPGSWYHAKETQNRIGTARVPSFAKTTLQKIFQHQKINFRLHLKLSPCRGPQRVFKGGEEQARELNLLEDWGREW